MDLYNITTHPGWGNTYAANNVSAVIGSAASAAKAAHKTLWLPSSIETYYIKDTIRIPAGVSVEQEGSISCLWNDSRPAVEVGSPAEANDSNVRLHFNEIRRLSLSDWTDPESTGLRLHNLSASRVEIGNIVNFTRGLDCVASNGKPFVHNRIDLGSLLNNRYGLCLRLVRAFGQPSPWINENTFVKGTFAISSEVRPSLDNAEFTPIGIWFAPGSGTAINSNLFIHPSFELSGGKNPFSDMVPWLIEFPATANAIIHARHENLKPVFLRITSGNVAANTATLGYTVPSYKVADMIEDVTQSNYGNFVRPAYQGNLVAPLSTSSWNSGFLADRAIQSYQNGRIMVPGCHWRRNVAPHVKTLCSTLADHAIGLDYVEIGGNEAICKIIDVSECKQLLIKPSCKAGWGNLRLSLRAYADDMTTALVGTSPTYVLMSGGSYRADHWGGSYSTGINGDVERNVNVHSDVQYLELIMWHLNPSASPAKMRLKSLLVAALDGGSVPARSVFSSHDPDLRYVGEAPTVPWKGTLHEGLIVHHLAPTPSSPWGWRLVGGLWQALNP